jgi:hypothetical protein
MGKKAKSVTDTPSSAPPWQASTLTYLAGRAHIDGVDALAVEMERKWGVGRLRLLVAPEWREKFDRQRLKFNMAIRQGDVAEVETESKRMAVAWRTIDRLATEAGAATPSVDVWEVPTPDGDAVLAIVRGSDVRPPHDGRAVQVWTLEEVARVIQAFPQIAKCKEVWPGATVEFIRPPPNDPLEHIDDVGDLFNSEETTLGGG